MFINNLDKLLEEILNNFYLYLEEKKVIKKIQKDVNFVKFQPEIDKILFNFFDSNISNIKKKLGNSIKKTDQKLIENLILRYLGYYMFLSIGYYYSGGRDIFITNIIEIAKAQSTSKRSIPNFYDSENNSIIIGYFSDIKNLLGLLEFKTIDRIKIVISNAPIKYDNISNMIKLLGEDYFENFFLIKNNNHNIIKTIIFRLIYLNRDREDVIDIVSRKEKDNSEYKFIEIVVSKDNKLVDFTIIQNFLSNEQLNPALAKDLYEYLEDYNKSQEIYLENKDQIIDYIFTENIFIPVSQDFLKYHRDNEKYEFETKDFRDRDATKIKYIVNKFFKVQSLHAEHLKKKPNEKKKILDMFYKQLSNRDAVLYNDTEDLKIIQKLLLSEKTDDLDLLIDLENIRRYAYLNYKTINGDGFKIRPSKSIRTIRQTNLKRSNIEKSLNIETRGTNTSIDSNIVGIVFNPSGVDLNCFTTKDLINVRRETGNTNGYNAFGKILNNNFSDKKFKKNKLYFWEFDLSKDNIELSSYQNITNNNKKKLKIMIEELFMTYFNNIVNKIYNLLKNKKNISSWLIKNFIEKINKEVVNLELDKTVFNKLIFDMYSKLPNIKSEIKIKKIPESDIIRLPIIKSTKDSAYIKKINIKEIGDNIEIDKDDNAICHHYIEWIDIKKISRKNVDEKNQAIFDFVKKYVRENKRGDFICKSCGEFLKLRNYIFEGTYVKELDIFLTTSLAVQQNLEEIPKYVPFNKIIKNNIKNLERIANVLNITNLLGNLPEIRLRKKLVVKNVLDYIIIHSQFIRVIGEKEKRLLSDRYNNKLTNLIFFKLEDSIYVTSSDDTDKLKLLKVNNLLSYLILFILTDINHGMILQMKEDKKLNFFFFNRFKDALFGNLKIRVNEKETILVKNIPLFAYSLYMLTGASVNNSMWSDSNYDTKKIPIYQKILIHTVVDIYNTILEAYFSSSEKVKKLEGNYLYELIAQKFISKLSYVFNDSNILEKLSERSNQMIRKKDNKISFITKKINNIKVNKFDPNDLNDLVIETSNSNVIPYKLKSDNCLTTFKLDTTINRYNTENYDEFTNCPDGNLHNWGYNDSNLICKNCKASFQQLFKKYNNTTTEKDDDIIFENIKYNFLTKITKNYCLDGTLHDISSSGKCNKCKLDPIKHSYTKKELDKLEKNLKDKKIQESLQIIKNNKKKKEILLNKKEKISKILLKFEKRYVKHTKMNLKNYISEFINKLEKKSGGKIKYDKNEYYLKLNKFIINNDYSGKQLQKPITILSEGDYNVKRKDIQNDISKYYHSKIEKYVYLYYNRGNHTYFFYDCNTLIFLGSSENIKDIKFAKFKNNIKIIPSIKHQLLNLGLINNHYNLYTVFNSLVEKSNEYVKNFIKINNNLIVNNIIETRVNNLKQIIHKMNELIEKINNKQKIKINYFNSEQNKIVNDFTKLINNIELTDPDGSNSVFKHKDYILGNIKSSTNLKVDENKFYLNPFPILDLEFLNEANLMDSKLIFFIIYNFNRLIDYNQGQQISILNYLLVRLIHFNYNQYWIGIEKPDVKKFISYIYTDQPYMDDRLRVAGIYNELVDDEVEIDEETKNAMMDNIEANDALDIFDYEADDSEGENYVEALDYEQN